MLPMLESLNPGDLFELTQRVISTLGVSRLLLGRCLLTIDSTDVAGCSGSIHFAGLHGIDHREAREARRVSRCLEDLPQLRKAAPETEERWLHLAQNLNYRKIARIVSRTRVGEIPIEDQGGAIIRVSVLVA